MNTTMTKHPQVIVCAAMRRQGLIVCGVRHFDPIMRAQIKAMGIEDHCHWEQGFVDQYGEFIDRVTAWEIADDQGQIRRPTGLEEDYEYQPRAPKIGDKGLLFSENLY